MEIKSGKNDEEDQSIMRPSFHVQVVPGRAGPSTGLTFMAVFVLVAFPLGVAVALHALNAPISAINSFLQQGVDLLTQICASLLTLFFHIITFSIQVSLNLLKSIVTTSFRALASRTAKLAGNFSNKFSDESKPANNDLIAQQITRRLKDSITSAASYVLRLLKRQVTQSFDSLSSLVRDCLVKLHEKIINSGKDINDDITSSYIGPLESIASGFVQALVGLARNLFWNSASSIAELAKDSTKALAERIGNVLERWSSMVDVSEGES